MSDESTHETLSAGLLRELMAAERRATEERFARLEAELAQANRTIEQLRGEREEGRDAALSHLVRRSKVGEGHGLSRRRFLAAGVAVAGAGGLATALGTRLAAQANTGPTTINY